MAERSVGASIARGLIRASRWTGHQIRGEVVRRVGGAARARVVVVFGIVLWGGLWLRDRRLQELLPLTR